MKFHVKCHIFLGLFFFLQLNQTGGKTQEELTLFIQKNVEHLIEKILSQVQEYYQEIKSNAKCIPDYIPDSIMETLKKSIDCVSENERNYASGKIEQKKHIKNFLKCFSNAKKEVNNTMTAIVPYEDYCPENMTEKTYEINITTTFIKMFHINIKNGLEVTQKEIDFGKSTCFNQFSRDTDDNDSRDHGNNTNSDDNSDGNVSDYEYKNSDGDDKKENENNHDNDDDDENDNDNDSEGKHKTDTNSKNEQDNYSNSENQSHNNEEDENSPEEDFADEYSFDDDNPKDDQENSSDDYADKFTPLNSFSTFQPNDNGKSVDF